MEFEYDPVKSDANAKKHGINFGKAQELWMDDSMSETNSRNLEDPFDSGESVLDYFQTDVILTADRLADLASILNLSAVAREAGIKVADEPRRSGTRPV